MAFCEQTRGIATRSRASFRSVLFVTLLLLLLFLFFSSCCCCYGCGNGDCYPFMISFFTMPSRLPVACTTHQRLCRHRTLLLLLLDQPTRYSAGAFPLSFLVAPPHGGEKKDHASIHRHDMTATNKQFFHHCNYSSRASSTTSANSNNIIKRWNTSHKNSYNSINNVSDKLLQVGPGTHILLWRGEGTKGYSLQFRQMEFTDAVSALLLKNHHDDNDRLVDDSNNNNNNNNKDPPRRRFKVKYTTVTGNNFAVERKGLVDAYEVEGMIYMLMTGSNAVLFDKKGIERDTVEYIVDSFRVQPTYGV